MTTFVLHAFGKETATEALPAWPTWGYTAWTYDIVVSRRDGASPTLELSVEVAPVPEDDDLYEAVHVFTALSGATILPNSQTQAETLPVDARWHRLAQAVTGTWWYQAKATVKLFDPATAAHLALLAPRVQAYSDLADLAQQAEDDVVRRYTQREGFGHPLTAHGYLRVRTDEDTGPTLREAIARRIDWLYHRMELEKSAKEGDGARLKSHLRMEWAGVDEALRVHDDRVPLYGF